MIKLFAWILFALVGLFSISVSAKIPFNPLFDKVITGKITEAQNGAPLAGVSVILKGTNIGTATNDQGSFRLSVPDAGGVLVISNTGFANQEINIGSQNNFSVKLTRTAAGLDEVVVIGYGTQKKKEVTASIASVKSENFVKGAVNDAGQLLQGKVVGYPLLPREEVRLKIHR